MPLPGNLSLGIIDEDNPLKSYFRYKPLLIDTDGQYAPFLEYDLYPEDGCIRIVPDKNESSHFKARMRRMGLFAVVDLSEHTGENDKIRANKNFRGDDSERNTHIIYSDVIREPADDMIFSILDMNPAEAEYAALPSEPATARVILRDNDQLYPHTWIYSAIEGEENAYRLVMDGKLLELSEMQRFELAGFNDTKLCFVVYPRSKMDSVMQPLPVKPSKAQKQPASVVEETAQEFEPDPLAEPATAVKEFVKETILRPAPLPHRVNGSQTGLNPRRGRSLQEIIDDKWRHSRLDQLGHPVPGTAQAHPVASPVERAFVAVREVWDDLNQREALLSACAKIESFEHSVEAFCMDARQSAINEQLTELEAQRLKALADLDALKKNREALRDSFKQEIRRDEAEAFADAVQKTEAAKRECARYEAAAQEAKSAAASAEDALNALSDGRFEARLSEFAITSHAAEMLQRLHGKPAPAPIVTGVDATADELIARVMECFADAGRPIDQNHAVNLLICAAQSPFMLFSGPSGSGKSETVRLLARALGAESVEFAPGKEPLAQSERVQALLNRDVPAIVMLDDANLVPNCDTMRGLITVAENSDLLLYATIQDSDIGTPLSMHPFDRAFTLRLEAEDASASWAPRPTAEPKTYAPVSAAALRKAFAPKPDAIPEAQIKRMEKLRRDLSLFGVLLSRRTLDALWNYCAAAIPLMQLAPSEVLDWALAQRALFTILSSAPIEALANLSDLLGDMPRCKKLLAQPLPVMI